MLLKLHDACVCLYNFMQNSCSQNGGKDDKDIQGDEEGSLQQSWADEEIADSGGQLDGNEGGERRYKRRPFTQVELENLVTGVKRYSGSNLRQHSREFLEPV